MVYPVNKVKFTVGIKGLASTADDMKIVRDAETFTLAFDNGVEEWNPMDQSGWVRRLLTSKSITVTLDGKRNVGDPGNDYIAGLAYANGEDATTLVNIEFPNGDVLVVRGVVNVKENGGGDSTAVGALSWELMSDGEPTYTVYKEEGN
ncbi:MAG: hypothetical protein LBB94_05405 [Clostridiales bacterium]|jgi:hypothetical protein|nr:hypothetical protein [Clostridiales bacterium]